MATIKLETSPRGLRLPWVSGACGWFSVNEHRADGAPAFRCLMGGDGTSHRRGIHGVLDAVSGFRGPLSSSGSLSATERSAVLAGPTWIAGMLPRRSNPQRPPPAHPGSEKERKGATNARDGRHCSFSLLIAPGNGEIRSPSLLFAPFRSFSLPAVLARKPWKYTAYLRSPREGLSRRVKRVVRFALGLDRQCERIGSRSRARESIAQPTNLARKTDRVRKSLTLPC